MPLQELNLKYGTLQAKNKRFEGYYFRDKHGRLSAWFPTDTTPKVLEHFRRSGIIEIYGAGASGYRPFLPAQDDGEILFIMASGYESFVMPETYNGEILYRMDYQYWSVIEKDVMNDYVESMK